MSSTSFTAFYTEDLRATIAHLSHKGLRVYVLMSTYADRSGLCWPGLKELSERSGLHPESILFALDELEKLGLMVYARRNEKDPVTKRQLYNVYQIMGCLVKADSEADSELKHENESTNVITNDNNQESINQVQAPPPLTNEPRFEEQKQAVGGDDYATQGQKPKRRAKAKSTDSSAAGTAPQNSKALPPIAAHPPLPDDFDPDTEMTDQDNEAAARWLCSEAMTRMNGGEYRATMSMANARRYIARYDRWRIRAALNLSRRDPATKSVIGRMDYLLRTSVASETQSLQDEMARLYGDDAQAGD